MARNYIMRLDDDCEKRNIGNWDRMENLLDRYGIKPIVGIIPNCQDPDMEKYARDDMFWNRVFGWQEKGWIIAMHGYTHVFCTKSGGINPVNHYSEFAGLSLEEQKDKISKGYQIFKEHGIEPEVFFAPAHTFDTNTIEALTECTDIRVVSDTIANDVYCDDRGITYIPQQSGRVRRLPFKTVTFCYHPNNMKDVDFAILEDFIKQYKKDFREVLFKKCDRRLSIYDRMLVKMYFTRK